MNLGRMLEPLGGLESSAVVELVPTAHVAICIFCGLEYFYLQHLVVVVSARVVPVNEKLYTKRDVSYSINIKEAINHDHPCIC